MRVRLKFAFPFQHLLTTTYEIWKFSWPYWYKSIWVWIYSTSAQTNTLANRFVIHTAYKIFNVVSSTATAANGIWLWQIVRKSLSILLSADVAWCIHLNSYPHSHSHKHCILYSNTRAQPYLYVVLCMAWKC